MATVSLYWINYQGPVLHPGAEHVWSMTHPRWQGWIPGQINVSAHPIVFAPGTVTPPAPQELEVTSVRSHAYAESGRVLYATVRNTGPNPVGLYYVYVSLVEF